ncbi:PEP-CTERM sorting domain-containing protein [Thermodesulfobacteriota bacterium]
MKEKLNFLFIVVGIVVTFVLFSVGPNVAHALIISADSVSGDDPFNTASRLIDGSGLNTTGDVSTWTHDFRDGSGLDANWTAPTPDPEPFDIDLDFSLGGLYNLTNIHIWNYTNTTGFFVNRDTTGIDVFTSTDGSVYTPKGSFSLVATNNAVDPEGTQTFALSGAASHVRLTITANHGPAEHGAQVGLGEVRFEDTTAPIPEPTTMLLLGSGLIGLAGFRRKFRKK